MRPIRPRARFPRYDGTLFDPPRRAFPALKRGAPIAVTRPPKIDLNRPLDAQGENNYRDLLCAYIKFRVKEAAGAILIPKEDKIVDGRRVRAVFLWRTDHMTLLRETGIKLSALYGVSARG